MVGFAKLFFLHRVGHHPALRATFFQKKAKAVRASRDFIKCGEVATNHLTRPKAKNKIPS